MDRINELLGRVSELSDAELSELEGEIATEFESVEKQGSLSAQIVEQMTALADAADAVRAEQGRRAEEATELSRLADEASARIHGSTPEGGVAEETESADVSENVAETSVIETASESTDPVTELSTATITEPEVQEVVAEVETEEVPTATAEEVIGESVVEAVAEEPVVEEAVEAEVVAEAPTEEIETPEVEAVAASADENAETISDEEASEREDSEAPVTAAANEPEAQIEVPVSNRPHIQVSEAPVAITAGADIPGVTAGAPLDSMSDVAKAMVQRMHAMRRTSGGDGEQHTVATLTASYSSERTLTTSDLEGNSAKIQSVISPQAITAAGGLCAPVNVRYDVFGFGSNARPVKDALAVFNADRGGIRFVAPPTLGDLNGAASLWTVQDDIDASTAGAPDPVKPCIRVACGAETTVTSDAIPLCLTFGNMGARAYPEMVTRHNELGMIQHARFAETRLLTRIGALSTAVSAATVLGAARDFFEQLDRAAAGYRNRHRLDSNSPLRVIAPAWLYNMMRGDLVMQLPGDGDAETFALAESKINSWLAVRGINASWTMDGETGQVLGAQAAGALNAYPATVVWYLFSEGTFLFLDGGTLDMGLVRDSTLNGTNDYKMFVETFEGVAKVGIESLRVSSSLEVNGTSSATTAV